MTEKELRDFYGKMVDIIIEALNDDELLVRIYRVVYDMTDNPIPYTLYELEEIVNEFMGSQNVDKDCNYPLKSVILKLELVNEVILEITNSLQYAADTADHKEFESNCTVLRDRLVNYMKRCCGMGPEPIKEIGSERIGEEFHYILYPLGIELGDVINQPTGLLNWRRIR